MKNKLKTRKGWQLWLQYVSLLALWAVAMTLVFYLSWRICQLFWWERTPLWYLLNWVRQNAVLVLLGSYAVGWLVISYRFIARPQKRLEEIIDAAKQLAHPDETPIQLSRGMEDVQSQLNLFRERALRDAYGHGAVPVAQCLEREGIDAFAVACLEEGITLRKAGVKGTILVLGYTPPQAAPELCRWQLTQTVADEEHGRTLNAAGLPLTVHLALDTGMHRLGIPAEDTAALARLYTMENLNITGVFSHLCVSDSRVPDDRDYTLAQLDRFFTAVEWLRENGYDPGAVHIQASGGILNLPYQPCDYARAGIALYGAAEGDGLRPVLALRARVACVQTLATGERAGYGLDFRAGRDTKLAVLTIGYADGLPRDLPQNGGQVLLHGQFCPMVGRMCMDQLFVDVTDAPVVSHGDIATLIGWDGSLEIQVEELAYKCGTIPNELLARLGSRLGSVVQ